MRGGLAVVTEKHPYWCSACSTWGIPTRIGTLGFMCAKCRSGRVRPAGFGEMDEARSALMPALGAEDVRRELDP